MIVAIMFGQKTSHPQTCGDKKMTKKVIITAAPSHVYGRLTDHFFGMYAGVTAASYKEIDP